MEPNKWLKCVEEGNADAKKILRVSLGLVEPEDVFQECFLDLLERGKSREEILRLLSTGPKRYRALKNKTISIWRSENAAKRGGTDPSISLDSVDHIVPSSEKFDPEKLLIHKEEMNLLEEVLKRAELSDTERMILELDMGGVSSPEIAQEMGTTPDTVYVRRSNYKKKLIRVLATLLSEKNQT
jgi:RNA polymerase sigma factor (sigma-70 family)